MKKAYYIMLAGETLEEAKNSHKEPFKSIEEAVNEAKDVGYKKMFRVVDQKGKVIYEGFTE